ncbi:MAG: hypothetical protein WC907_07995 [Acholeplasmataceae bacterium]|jgi:hypothetical protein
MKNEREANTNYETKGARMTIICGIGAVALVIAAVFAPAELQRGTMLFALLAAVCAGVNYHRNSRKDSDGPRDIQPK